MDQGAGNKAYLVSYEDGKVLRSFETETDKSSGITFDGEALWIGSTYSREIFRVDAMTGKTIERRFTPGAGIIYQMVGDPPGRSSPILKTNRGRRGRRRGRKSRSADSIWERCWGARPGYRRSRPGMAGRQVVVRRASFARDLSHRSKSWVVEAKFSTAGNRPHGIGWEGKYLWATDSNLNAFFKHDPETGEMVEKIQLAETDPLPHGMTIWQGTMWYCDDVGVVCRLKL